MTQTLDSAIHLALNKKNQEVEVVHLLWSLLINTNSVLNQVLNKHSVEKKALELEVQSLASELPSVSSVTKETIKISNNLYRSFQNAQGFMSSNADEFVAVDSWLLANIDNEVFKKVFLKYLAPKELKATLLQMRGEEKITSKSADELMEALQKYTIDITALAKENKLDPVIGREEQIARMMQILIRKTKNNPILLGEPGVGKTAIIEGFAKRIVDGDVPKSLLNKKILSLDMSTLIAGAKYRGEFEDRLKAILKEVQKANNIVLFIDEIHTIIGAGASEGSMDAANILKPFLARGKSQTIGATTLKEYRKYFEKDSAMQRRFQPIDVNEPSANEAIAMLRGIKEKLENHHNVTIEDSAIIGAVKLSDRYIQNRFLPDKAIDLIDEAAAELKMQIESEPSVLSQVKREIASLQVEKQALLMDKNKKETNQNRLKEIEQELANLEERHRALKAKYDNEKHTFGEISELKAKIDELKIQASDAKRRSQFDEAAKIEYGELPEIQKQLEAKEAKWQAMQNEEVILRNYVDEEAVAGVVSRWSGIPVSKMQHSQKERIRHIEETLKEQIIGQDEAVSLVSKVIKRNKAGLSDNDKPIGSFLFLGTTGVGKTQLAKTLANFLFDSERAMVRLDMSEYMEKASASRLIGAPPGYVGYEEGGQLTEAVRRNPYSILLFDEIEKAHSDVFNILLQVLDDGRLTDNKGVVVDFKNTIIILTSNIASDKIAVWSGVDKEEERKEAFAELKKFFKPEFLNRLDEIVVFKMLDQKAVIKIVDILIASLEKKLKEHNLSVQISQELKNHIAEVGFDASFGARPLKRALYEIIEDRISDLILEERVESGSVILFDYKEDEVSVEIGAS